MRVAWYPRDVLLLLHVAFAGPSVPPTHRVSDWAAPIVVDQPGTRVAMIVEARGSDAVRIDVSSGGAWISAYPTWHKGRVSVMVADLPAPATRVRLRSPDASRITALDADLFARTDSEPRRAFGVPPPSPGVLPAELVAIGVTSRAEWGADPTTCSSTEDEWYRMAIHHTAGTQTYGGTVQGAVQALQAYALGTGEYCDIPYQFLVGYDGSLWEGRPYDYYSGATGGNNDGNVAVCFLGCYHPTGCATSNEVTEEMMDGGQLLVQTLVALDGIPSDADSIRGHRDWPDNATACPGDWLYDRLDELREPLAPAYAGTFHALACTPLVDGRLEAQVGATASCTLDMVNAGRSSWTPGTTKLAPIPRDTASELATSSWLDAARITSVTETVAPGGTGRFAFDLSTAREGDFTLSLGMLEEWVTWFADDGGPADGAMSVELHVVPVGQAETGDPGDSPGGDSESGGGATDLPGDLVSTGGIGGCGCGTAGDPGAEGLALASAAGVALLLRRPQNSPATR